MRKLRTHTITHHHIALTTLGLAAVSLILAVMMVTKLHAESYDVTATVPASLPPTAAFITFPSDEQHVSTTIITVSGTCPDTSYVTVSRDGILSGTSPCVSNTFTMQLSLVPGANLLLAKVYNITNNEGPASPPVTVFYDAVNPPTPSESQVDIFGVDFADNTAYQSGRVFRTSARPTFAGHAPAGSNIVVAFTDTTHECKTTSSASGHWSCTLGSMLSDGTYLVEISAETPQKTILKMPPFYIVVSSAIPSLFTPLQGIPLTVTCLCGYQTHKPGEQWKWDVIISAGVPPYTVTVDWGDKTNSKLSGSQTQPLITHIFKQAGEYKPLIKVTDAAGNVAVLQLYAPVMGEVLDIDSTFAHFNIPLWVMLLTPFVIGVIIIMILGARKLLLSLVSKIS